MKRVVPALLGAVLVCGMAVSADARDVSGKVMGIYHEPVTVNNKTLDKVSVSVNNCETNQWETFSYSPGSVSDDNSLGFLFDDLANAARSVSMKNQYMKTVSGHVTLSVNDQNVIQKTQFWGHNWECGQDVEGQAAPAASAGAAQPAAAQAPAKQEKKPANPMRRFGF